MHDLADRQRERRDSRNLQGPPYSPSLYIIQYQLILCNTTSLLLVGWLVGHVDVEEDFPGGPHRGVHAGPQRLAAADVGHTLVVRWSEQFKITHLWATDQDV